MLSDVVDLEKFLLPAEWRKVCDFGPSGAAYCSLGGLRVIVTDTERGDHENSDDAWRHISVSREGRLPSYDDLVTAKELFAGTEAKAVMVFPPRSKHVNIAKFCLHLFVCLTSDPLPEFSGEVGGVRIL